jgi:hypothetical protein
MKNQRITQNARPGVRIRSRRKAREGAVQGQLQAGTVSRIRIPTSRRAPGAVSEGIRD